jgi:hypothetical protein|tara:strand:- start:1135 stop:1380 length:246 start_codon:yes stop_codon:yes gene_type:complete
MKKLILLLTLVAGVGVYFLMSPYQECMKDDTTQYLAQVHSSAANKSPEEAEVFLKDICRHWAKEIRWDFIKEFWKGPPKAY